MGEYGVTEDEIVRLEEWLDTLEDDEWESAIDSLGEEVFEAIETRALYRELKKRYAWDIFKLVILIAYPTILILLYVFRSSLPLVLPDWIPSSISSLYATLLQDVPAIGSIATTIFMAMLQIRNVKHFRADVIPLANEIKERKIAALE